MTEDGHSTTLRVTTPSARSSRSRGSRRRREPADIAVKLQERFGHLATSIALYKYAGGTPRDLVPAYTRFRAARS